MVSHFITNMKSLLFSAAVYVGAVVGSIAAYGQSAQQSNSNQVSTDADSAFTIQVKHELSNYRNGEWLYERCDAFSHWINYKAELAVMANNSSANKGEHSLPFSEIDTNVHNDISHSIEDEDEPSIAINRKNPNLIIAGANDLAYSANGQAAGMNTLGMPSYVTTDGGFTWKTYRLPLVNDAGAEEWGDPMIISNDSGMFYYSFLLVPALGGYSDLMVARSIDGKHWTLGNPVMGNFNSEAFEDKETIASDNDPKSPYYGRVYIAWTEYQNTGNTTSETMIHYIAHSDDHGDTWSAPVPFTQYYGDFALLRVGHAGMVFIASMHYYDSAGNTAAAKSHGLSVSTDGGATFQGYPIHDFTDFPPVNQGRDGLKGPNGFRASPYPSFDVDTGTTLRAVYGTYDDFNGDAALFEVTSSDLGKHWRAPRQIGTPEGINNDHYMPWLSIDPVTHAAYVSMSSSEEDTLLNVESRAVWCNYSMPNNLVPMGSDLFNTLRVTASGGDFLGDYATSDAYDGYFAASWTENRQPAYHDGEIFAYVSGPLPAPGPAAVHAINADEFSVGNISPNPASGNSISLTIASNAERSATIRLFDLKGNEIVNRTESIQPIESNSILFDIHSLPAGVYHVLIQSGQDVVSRNLVILR